LCYLLGKLHLHGRTQHRFILNAPYRCDTYFGPFSSHHEAYQYKRHLNEDKIKQNIRGLLFTVSVGVETWEERQIKNSILIIVQRDATQSSLFIILQVHSTCFGCQPHPSSRVHKTVTTASGTGHIFCVQLPASNEAKLATLEGGWCTGWERNSSLPTFAPDCHLQSMTIPGVV
jgi:hypothetical protein